MIEHGIMTSKADYWVHFFPISRRVYWYRVDHAREYIRQRKIPITLGGSADGTPTGNGYLVSKTAYFVSWNEVPKKYVEHTDWLKSTDREKGFNGESVVNVLIEHRIVQFPPSRPTSLRTKQDQLDSTDTVVRWTEECRIEVKTECREGTENLFIQTREGGHRVHQIRGEQGTERFSEAPGFEVPDIQF